MSAVRRFRFSILDAAMLGGNPKRRTTAPNDAPRRYPPTATSFAWPVCCGTLFGHSHFIGNSRLVFIAWILPRINFRQQSRFLQCFKIGSAPAPRKCQRDVFTLRIHPVIEAKRQISKPFGAIDDPPCRL